MDNYPLMSASELEAAPFNQSELESREFQITCSQTLSKSVKVDTNNYIPESSGIDCEPDGDGGYIKTYYTDSIDTSNTNWADEYHENDYHTPIQLLELFKQCLEEHLSKGIVFKSPKFTYNLIDECKGWIEDETEYIED